MDVKIRIRQEKVNIYVPNHHARSSESELVFVARTVVLKIPEEGRLCNPDKTSSLQPDFSIHGLMSTCCHPRPSLIFNMACRPGNSSIML